MYIIYNSNMLCVYPLWNHFVMYFTA